MYLTYILSASNKWADALSRNHYPLPEMRRRWADARYVAVLVQVDDWVARVCATQGSSKLDEERWRSAEEEVAEQSRGASGLQETTSGG